MMMKIIDIYNWMKHAHIFKSQRNFYILMQMNTSSFIPDESFLKDIDMVLYKYHLKKNISNLRGITSFRNMLNNPPYYDKSVFSKYINKTIYSDMKYLKCFNIPTSDDYQKIIRYLSYLFQLSYLINNNAVERNTETFINSIINNPKDSAYNEYIKFSESDNAYLRDKNVFSFYNFAEKIVKVLSDQYTTMSCKEHNTEKKYIKKREFKPQYTEFENKINCFGEYTYERLNACIRLAESNALAAQSLSNYYYYGSTVYSGTYPIKIEKNISLALQYNIKCHDLLKNPALIPSASWSIAYIIHRYYEKTSENIEKAKLYLNDCGAYAAAFNLLGNIEREEAQHECENGNDDLAVQLYISAINYYIEAMKQEYLFAYNNLIVIYEDDNLKRKLYDKTPLWKDYSLDKLFSDALKFSNHWLINHYGVYLYNKAQQDQSPNVTCYLQKSKQLLEKAAKSGYLPAYTNLAQLFYIKDTTIYELYLQKAYNNGGYGSDPKAQKLLDDFKNRSTL